MMRLLFLILLVANLAAFFLLRDSQDMPGAHSLAPVPAAAPLQLLSELTPQERAGLARINAVSTPPPTPAATSRAAPAATAALACASYGPFPGADAAKTGTQRLSRAGAEVHERLVPGKVRLGYWVYLPAFHSRKEAEAAEKLLQKRGVKDIYVVADEADRNAISLGVFSQRSGAVERQKKIRTLGFHPLLADRFRDTPNYWLDARGTAAALPAATVFADLAEGDAGIGRADLPCAGASG
ncbi:MAG TPA: SPOR domain-containing protein [Gammaproteobacteria bacterium]|nr:SPOR domain-containing protein [Gammaproteobacteria bacterium]